MRMAFLLCLILKKPRLPRASAIHVMPREMHSTPPARTHQLSIGVEAPLLRELLTVSLSLSLSLSLSFPNRAFVTDKIDSKAKPDAVSDSGVQFLRIEGQWKGEGVESKRIVYCKYSKKRNCELQGIGRGKVSKRGKVVLRKLRYRSTRYFV